MIASWMLYCALCAAGLSLAAVFAERALLAGRGPVRFVWIGAVALSLLVPAAQFRLAPRAVVPAPAATVNHDVAVENVTDIAIVPVTPAQPVHVATSPPARRVTLASLDQPLVIAWMASSVALAFNFFGGIFTLSLMRRRWQERNVMGLSVFISDRTGPAVVGVLTPAIVLPEWVLSLEPYQLALMLRHEQEHRRAGDGRLLTVAQLALIVMPWNIALWWQVLRLRVAVELDCDARVLQHGDDPRSYGNLLLEVARPRRGPSFMGATAFAERATQLERRIRVLARHRSRPSRVSRALATGIALIALTVAWVAPRPAVPARAAVTPPAPLMAPAPRIPTPAEPTSQTPITRLANAPEKPAPIGTKPNLPDKSARAVALSAQPPATIAKPADSALSIPVPSTMARPSPPDRALLLQMAPRADSILDRLFQGITLSPSQQARARDLLGRLALEQQALDEARNATMQANRATIIALQAARDTALRALLTNDVDRVAFDTRLATSGARGRVGGGGFDALSAGGGGRGGRGGGGGGGGGGRSTGPGDTVFSVGRFNAQSDSLVLRGRVVAGNITIDSASGRVDGMRLVGAAGRGGGGLGGGGRGGGGARGGGGDPAAAMSPVQLAEFRQQLAAISNQTTFTRLFGGMSLTPDQEASARALIEKTQQEMPVAPTPEVRLRFNWNTGYATMQQASANALLALVTDEADRAVLQSRLIVYTP